MFRGGRVDARGTGITSNLGYNNGGRVGLKNGGGYQFGETPAAKSLGWLNNEFNKMLAAGYDLGAVPVNTFARMFGYNPGFSGAKWMDTMTMGEFTKNNPDINPDQAWFLNPWGPTSAEKGWTIPSMSGGEAKKVTGVNLPPGGGRIRLGTGEDFYEAPEKKEKSTEELLKELMGPKKTKKETIEEYTEIFKDAYGSGVADDASTMALSLAGKMLKPEATVKSGFGEFFEEESKRPSSRKKYKDAATTAAINAFLTGEKDYDSMMKQMKIIDYQLEKKDEYATSKKTIDSLLSAYAGNAKDDRTDPGVMQAAYNDLYKTQIFEGPLPENKDELIVGKIYYQDHPGDSRNKIIFLVKADGSLKQINTILKQEDLKWLYLNPSMIKYEE